PVDACFRGCWHQSSFVDVIVDPFMSRDPGMAQPETVAHHTHRTERHCCAREYGTEQDSEARVEHSGSYRDSDHVVDEGPEQVLLHRPKRTARQPDGIDDASQIAAH